MDILVMGDFNFHLNKIATYFKTTDIHGSSEKKTATRNVRNQLDEIFTNQKI